MRKLLALDEDDLAVISAHVQDALVHPADILWRPSEKRLVIGMKRLDWDQVLSGTPTARHLVAALRFDRVMACKARNLSLEEREEALEVIGVEFHAANAPGGAVVVMFSDGSALRLDVECIECELADLSEDSLGVAGLDTETPASAGG